MGKDFLDEEFQRKENMQINQTEQENVNAKDIAGDHESVKISDEDVKELDESDPEIIPDGFIYQSIRTIPVLTPEEEMHYAKLYLSGTDEEKQHAKEMLITHNLRYVLKIALHYKELGLDYDDLVQSGTLGLIRAIEKYDPDMGFRFTTYATHWIKQAITRNLADNGKTIRLPVHVQDTMRRIKNAERSLQQEQLPEREMVEMISEKTGLSVDKINAVNQTSASNVVSLDIRVSSDRGDGDTELLDFIPDESIKTPEFVAVKNALQGEIQSCMNQCLSKRELEVIQMRYGMDPYPEPMTLEKIGAIFGVTRERVRQIETNAMNKLRNPKYKKNLKVFLEA